MSERYQQLRARQRAAHLVKATLEVPFDLKATARQLEILRFLAAQPATAFSPAQLKEAMRLTSSPARSLRDMGILHDFLSEEGFRSDRWRITEKGFAAVKAHDNLAEVKQVEQQARVGAVNQLLFDQRRAYESARLSRIIKWVLIVAALTTCLWWIAGGKNP